MELLTVAEATGKVEWIDTQGRRHSPEPPWAAKLRQRAVAMGLKWEVVCTEDPDPDNAYLALAYPKDVLDGAIYYEDGAKPHWGALGSTQEVAAKNLLQDLSSSPNLIPDHRPSARKPNRQCKSPISGGYPDQPDAYANECKDCEK